jgi:AcrR family transcriptional regulator
LGVKKKEHQDSATRERLLDAAEILFGQFGYDGLGMRTLARKARVNLGAATYHFGSKAALYTETFMRRLRPANARRLQLLRQAEAAAAGRPVPVETIIDCMIRPYFQSKLGHEEFELFLARNLFMPPPFLNAAIDREFIPVAAAFVTALRRGLPHVPEDLLHLRVMFATGGQLMFSVKLGNRPSLHNPRHNEAILKEMVQFISTGMQSPPVMPAECRPVFPFPRLTRS